MKYHKWVNIVASATFGVYLIHDNGLIRQFLWSDIFKNSQYQESVFLIPYSIIVVAIVYFICTIIDLLRQRFIEKPFMVLVNRCSEQIIQKLKKIVNIVTNFVFGTQN